MLLSCFNGNNLWLMTAQDTIHEVDSAEVTADQWIEVSLGLRLDYDNALQKLRHCECDCKSFLTLIIW